MLYIDPDEFVVSPMSLPAVVDKLEREGFFAGQMAYTYCPDRFDLLDKYLIDSCYKRDFTVFAALRRKYIFRTNATKEVHPHTWVPINPSLHIQTDLDPKVVHFAHFNADIKTHDLDPIAEDPELLEHVQNMLISIGNPEWKQSLTSSRNI